MNDLEFIDGDFFENLADFSFENYGKPLFFYCKEFDEFLIKSKVKLEKEKNSDGYDPDAQGYLETPIIIFCETHRYREMLRRIVYIPRNVVLITHNSDVSITDIPIWPKNLIHWFSQNVEVVHDKLTPIPIGLERKRWFPELKKQETLREIMNIHYRKENLVYINFSTSTNPYRKEIIDSYRGKSWVTIQEDKISYKEYLEQIKKHYYVLSPEGNGIDCHRHWETLYCGSIPITQLSLTTLYAYNNIRMPRVSELKDLDYNFLESSKDNYNDCNFNQLCYYSDNISKDIKKYGNNT